MDQEYSTFFVPGYKDANSYAQDALRSILTATKASNELPSTGDDFDYYSSFPGFREVMFRKRQNILSLMTSIIQSHGIREKFQGREADEKYDLLVDVNDVILENVSNYLDEASGLKKPEEELVVAVKPPSSINTSWNKKQFSPTSQSFKLLTAKNISRPQLSFKDKVDNSNSAFIPTLKDKPNSIRPLAITLEMDGDREEYCHPYEWEIEKFSPPDEFLQPVDAVFPKPVEETLFSFVSTEEQLKQLCADLKKVKEFAVDLEHHNYRSFQGFTCLLQISTRERDYVVDALELRSELSILNEVFTDPNIVKVFHGADMDVLWLQKDFGIYLVNLFDTGQAARVLHLAHLSLSYLLKHYCQIEVDKKFQLADWRIRPLPAEMLKYAREDTHYLLYVYDRLKNDLLESGNEMKNLLLSTFERSKLICFKKYQKPLFKDDKYLELYKKCKKILNAKQLYCLRELYGWRDRVARENDESFPYVLPNHMLLQIAEALPREQQGILACCNPIPPLVKQQLKELHSIILRANDSSSKNLEALQLQEMSKTPKAAHSHIDLSSLIHCPHDIHHLEDKKEESLNQSGTSENLLPILTKSHSATSLEKKEPSFKAFFDKEKFVGKPIAGNVIEAIKKLISPFERYKISQEMDQGESSSKTTKVNDSTPEVRQQRETENESTNQSLIENEEIENSSEAMATDNAQDVLESTPLRKKNKKRKKSRPIPDVSLTPTPGSDREPPRKKSKTPEVSASDSFTPYDYNQADLSNFSGKRKSKERMQAKSNYQTPKPYFTKKRKHAKQATFSQEGRNQQPQNWPKKK